MSQKITLIVQHGQYEQIATKKEITYTTLRGLKRRIRQLAEEYSTYGDNWAGWIKASVTVASDNDIWYDNNIIGGQHCEPENDWIDIYDFSNLKSCML